MKKKMIVVPVAAFSIISSAYGEAATFILNNSLSETDIDWTAKESYVDASHAPTEGDTVVIPAGMVAKLSGADEESWALVSSLKRVTPEDGASFTVDVPSGEAVLGCRISWYTENVEPSALKGRLVKTGSGALLLQRRDDLFDDGKYFVDYYVNFDVQAGAVKLPTGETDAKGYRVGGINIAEGAEFYIPNWGSGKNDKILILRSLSGYGTLVSLNSNRERVNYPESPGYGKSVFYGAFKGKIYVTYGADFEYRGSSPDLTTGATRVDNNATLSVAHSIVSGNIGGYGTVKYIGDDPSSFVPREVWLTDYFTFDSGIAGDIKFTADVTAGDGNKLHSLTLAGENSETHSTFANQVYTNKPGAVIHLVKRGPGAWMLQHSNKCQLNGGIDVENGTLMFETIAEKGVVSSLGLSTELYSNVVATVKDKYKVPWAFLLGGDGTEGMLEYVGEKAAKCSTRPFAVRSAGGVANEAVDIAHTLSLSGFSAAGYGNKTLVLGGGNAGCNIASEISDKKYSADNKGSLGLAKRGSGAWMLSGDQSFSGPLEIKEGTLVVDNIPAAAPFRYFRFYIKENGWSACENNTADGYYVTVKDSDSKTNSGKEYRTANLARLHFYDQNGDLAVSNCVGSSYWPMADFLLPENTVTYTGENLPDVIHAGITNIFRSSSGDTTRGSVRFQKQPTLGDESTWGCVAIRVPDDAPEVHGYDIRTYECGYPFGNYSGRALVSWEIHGSADGVNYEKLHEVNSFKVWGGKNGTSNCYWAYDQTNAVSFASSHADGRFFAFSKTRSAKTAPASELLGNVSYISVEPGAVLDVRGDALEVKSIKVGASGMGQLKNVRLAESGQIEFSAEPKNEMLFPADLSHVVNAGNLSKWKLIMDGESYPSGRLSVTDSGIVYRSPGFLISVR